MNTLLRHIEYLISRHDCVIVPEFGALLAINISAAYNSLTHSITPPKRLFAFNAELTSDDESMLMSSIQRAEGLTEGQARQKVADCVAMWSQKLENTGELQLGNIGILKKNIATGLLTFESSEHDMLSTETIWLESLKLQPLVEVKYANIIEAPIKKQSFGPLKRFARAAASIAILLGIGFVASTPLPIDDAMKASMAPEVHKIVVDDYMTEETIEAATLDVILPQPGADSAIDCKVRPGNIQDTYYVVIASVTNEADAKEFMAYHSKMASGYYDKGTYYVIYSSKHTDVREAYLASLEVSEKYPQAWVCKK